MNRYITIPAIALLITLCIEGCRHRVGEANQHTCTNSDANPCAAVKVIDPRGNEVMTIVRLTDTLAY